MAARARALLVAACGLAATRGGGGVWGQIRVMQPESLVRQYAETLGRIDGTTATFGAPFYGQRILGRVIFAESPSRHCKDDEEFPASGSAGTGASELINIVMVRRGNCTFVRKVSVAEKHRGAHAVIIVDYEWSNNTRADIRRLILADDGYGQNVNIPSVLVAIEDGRRLIDASSGGKPVIVELAWDVPTQPVVVMDLWMSSASRESNNFLKAFSPRRKALNEAVRFVPHYYVFGMEEGTDYISLCTNRSAVFCAEDPDGSGPVTGKMVLEEDVRQLCIHNLTKVRRMREDGSLEVDGQKREYAEKYWDYVERFLAGCPVDAGQDVDPARRFGPECSERLAREVGVDFAAVARCASEHSDELLLEQTQSRAWAPRALRINGWKYVGALDAALVTRAICSAFTEQPKACQDLSEPGSWRTVELPAPSEPSGVGFGMFTAAMLVVCAGSCGALLVYKRSLHRHIHRALHEEVMLEVQSQMDSYRQLGGA